MGNNLNSGLSESSSSSDDDMDETAACPQDYDVPFHRLDDYTLQLIFSYVPFLERIALQRVCRRWKGLLAEMLQKVEHVDIPNGVPCDFPKEYRNLEFLKHLFKCTNLKKLNLQGNKISQVSGLVEAVVYGCPNLEELRFYRVGFHGYKLHMLKRLKKLKRLALHDCDPIKDGGLKFILKDKTSLTHLELTNCRGVRGKFLKYIHAPLEVLNLACQQKFKCWSLLAYMDRFAPTLKHLNLSSWEDFFLPSNLKEILQKLPNLESLTFEHKNGCNYDVDLVECLMENRKIETLNISHNAYIDDDFLQDLVIECPHLKVLDVSALKYKEYKKEDQYGHVSCLNRLPNLRWLNLSLIQFLKGEEIQRYAARCPPIEHLYLVSLPKLQDDDVKSLLTSCHQLKYLDVSDCGKVTEEILTAAVQALEARLDDQPLQLVVGGTKINKPTEEDPPLPSHLLLTVSFENNYYLMRNYFFLGANRYTFYGAKDDSEDDDEDAPGPLDTLVRMNTVVVNSDSEDDFVASSTSFVDSSEDEK